MKTQYKSVRVTLKTALLLRRMRHLSGQTITLTFRQAATLLRKNTSPLLRLSGTHPDKRKPLDQTIAVPARDLAILDDIQTRVAGHRMNPHSIPLPIPSRDDLLQHAVSTIIKLHQRNLDWVNQGPEEDIGWVLPGVLDDWRTTIHRVYKEWATAHGATIIDDTPAPELPELPDGYHGTPVLELDDDDEEEKPNFM